MSNAKSFFEKFNKIPTRYQDLVEGYEEVKDSNKLITFEIASALRKTAGNYLIGTVVPIYVYRGTADFVKKPVNMRDDSRQVGDILVRTYGSKVDGSQDVVGYVNVKTGDSWLASTSKKNLKALVGDKGNSVADGEEIPSGGIEDKPKVTEKKKVSKNPFANKNKKVVKKGKKNEAIFKNSGTFEDMNALKEELSTLGLKEGSDFVVKIFGDNIELFVNYAENAIPGQITDILGRYGFTQSEAPAIDTNDAPPAAAPTEDDDVVERYAAAFKKQVLEDRAKKAEDKKAAAIKTALARKKAIAEKNKAKVKKIVKKVVKK